MQISVYITSDRRLCAYKTGVHLRWKHTTIRTKMNSTEELLAQTEGTGGVSLKSPTFGYVAIVICAIGFGTNYLPVKKFKMGDGKTLISLHIYVHTINFSFIFCNLPF